MSYESITTNSSLPKYKQIVASIEHWIFSGRLKKDDKLPSLNNLRKANSFSRDTVIAAFNELKARGIIYSVVGKGYYVQTTNVDIQVKIFLLFDELNAFKEDLYNSFLKNLDSNFQVDLFFHHFNYKIFNKLITDNLDNYGYYVIMPANFDNVTQTLGRLPAHNTYILDQTKAELIHFPAIFQNFKKNIFEGLNEIVLQIKAYKKIVLIFEESKQPIGIKEGFEWFCKKNYMDYDTIESFEYKFLKKGTVYFILDDKDLIKLIKSIKQNSYQLGREIGVISYNDTLLKEILEGGITTISADFKFMGSHLAKMLKENSQDRVESPKKTILRNSL